MRSTQHPSLYLVNQLTRGRSVFTSEQINFDDLIEICPIILIPQKDLENIHNTVLHDYYFLWGKNHKMGAIALGFGSLYNHSDDPNACFEMNEIDKEIYIRCIKPIIPHEEITINYIDSDLRNDFELWFKDQP